MTKILQHKLHFANYNKINTKNYSFANIKQIQKKTVQLPEEADVVIIGKKKFLQDLYVHLICIVNH